MKILPIFSPNVSRSGVFLGLLVLGAGCLPLMAQGGWSATDIDADGLSDQWENHYFGNLSSNGNSDNDSDGLKNSLEFSSGRNPTLAETVPGTPDWHAVPGALRFERWNNVGGDTLASLYQSQAFIQSAPASAGFYTTAEIQQNQGDSYGLRLRGTLRAPVSGDYRFYVASDNQGAFYLGTGASRFTLQKLCAVNTYSGYRAWTANTSQASVLVTLAAGQEYAFEAVVKDGGGGDHLSIGWIRPGQTTVEVVPGKMPDGTVVLTSYAPDPSDLDDDGMLDSYESANNLNPNSRIDHAMLDSDGDGSTNLQEYQNGTAPVPLPGQSGFCQWDLFFIGTNNSKITALTQNPLFAQAPGLSGYFNAAEAGQNWGDNFGRRLRGVVTIPTTGTWRFYISGDNCTSLLINPSGKSRFGKSQVAFNTGASSFRSFSSGTPQSKAFNFNAGDKVYFEALYVETTGSDHCSVGWSGPGYTSATLIPSSAISVCEPETITIDGTTYLNDADNDSLPDDWESANGLSVTNSGPDAWLHSEGGDPDGDGLTNLQEYQHGTNPFTVNGVAGYWAHEWYGSIGGTRVRDLLGAAGLLRAPDLTLLSESTEQFVNYSTNFGQRFRATITAPATGDYTFWLAGDDEAELWISSDDRKFNKRRIATDAYGTIRGWEKNIGNPTEPVTLQQGQSYFIEVLHKQSSGSDHVSVGWSLNSNNWALSVNGSSATQSSTFGGWSASRAIDGNCSGSSNSNSTTHTNNTPNSWLEVDFGAERPVTRVVLFNRIDGTLGTRLSNFRISLRDASGNEIPGGVANFFEGTGFAPAMFAWDLPATVQARKVRVQLLGNNNDGNGHLSIAELMAFEIGEDVFPPQSLPASALTSFVRDVADNDDDYLIDSWEVQYGLSATDNGLANPGNGELGDPDLDNLTNRDEWLLGTDPLEPDTDGDGYPDGQEVYFLGTNPLVPELANPSVVGDIAVTGLANASANWVESADGGLFSMETRGWIDYQFNVSTAGYYLFEIQGRARGSAIQSREDFALDVHVDSKKVASTVLTSLNGQKGVAAGFAGWLSAGSHTLRIWNHNLLARRSLQLDSLRLVIPSGDDADTDGLPDWIYDFLTARNSLTATGLGSLTSPCCVEGTTRDWMGTTVSSNGSAFAPVAKGVDDQWFANVPLNPTAATGVIIGFEYGLLQQDLDIEWLPFNIAQSTHLVIRKNDSLRLTAFTPGGTPDGSNVTITLNGQALATTPANQPFIRQFATAGIQTLSATFTGPNGPETVTSTVEVIAADFGATFQLYVNRPRQWSVSNFPFTIPVVADSALSLTPQVVPWSARVFQVNTATPGTHTVLARTGAGGPVIATGQVNAMLLSQSDNGELPVIHVYPNGDTIVEFTVIMTGLPPGGYVELEFFLGGRSFLDGTIRKRLYAADFDENGIARVPMLFSSGIGTTCHRTFLRDASGTIIGQM